MLLITNPPVINGMLVPRNGISAQPHNQCMLRDTIKKMPYEIKNIGEPNTMAIDRIDNVMK